MMIRCLSSYLADNESMAEKKNKIKGKKLNMDFGDSVPARRRRRRPIGTETCQRQRITVLPNISPPTDGRSIP